MKTYIVNAVDPKMMSRRRTRCSESRIIFIKVTVVSVLLVMLAYSIVSHIQRLSLRARLDETFAQSHTINHPGCRIPKQLLHGPTVDPYYSDIGDLYCDNRTSARPRPRLIVDGFDFIHLNRSALQYYGVRDVVCGYRSFERVDGAADAVRYSANMTLITDLNYTRIDDEFITVECFDKETMDFLYKDFFAFVPLKRPTEERCCSNTSAWSNGTHQDSSISVLVIGVDSVSRMQVHRQLTLTDRLLKEQMNAIEMLGYHVAEENTYPNMATFLANQTIDELELGCFKKGGGMYDNCSLIWKYFEARGHRTVFAEEAPGLSIFNLFGDERPYHEFTIKGFAKQPTDYYLRPLYLEFERHLGNNNIGCGNRCLGSRMSLSFILKYAWKVAKRFDGRHFFAFVWTSTSTHDHLNYSPQVDQTISHTFDKLRRDNLLNDTVLVFMGDHGPRRKTDFVDTKQGRYEKRLPYLSFVFPPWFETKYGCAMQNLRNNTRMLCTHYDLRETLLDLSNLTRLEEDRIRQRTAQRPPSTHSLFLPISPHRNCTQARIPEEFCVCDGQGV